MYCLQKGEVLPPREDRFSRQGTPTPVMIAQGAAMLVGAISRLAAPIANAGNDGAAQREA